MESEYTTELTKIHHTNYVRNSRAIVVLWAIFSVIFLVLNVVVFLQPQWVGDSGDSDLPGYFGIWEICTQSFVSTEFGCEGDFLDFNSIKNSIFQTTSILVGVSCLFYVVAVGCFLLFCLLNTATVLKICSWFMTFSAILLAIAVIIFPSGWDESDIRAICGQDAGEYKIGTCEVRWAYILAIVLVFDAIILAVLGFVLAVKQANMLPELYKEDKKPIKD